MIVKIFWFNKKKYTHTRVCVHTHQGFSESSWKMYVKKKLCMDFKIVFLQHKHVLKFHFSVNFLKYTPFSPLSELA